MSKYFGYPEVVAIDQGPRFTSGLWASLLQAAGIKSQTSGVESHNAIGNGERYHSYLRHVFSKVCTDTAKIMDEHALAVTVKAVKDTSGPEVLLPAMLVFGVMPPIRKAVQTSGSNKSHAGYAERT